jgi:hypothetical protein
VNSTMSIVPTRGAGQHKIIASLPCLRRTLNDTCAADWYETSKSPTRGLASPTESRSQRRRRVVRDLSPGLCIGVGD